MRLVTYAHRRHGTSARVGLLQGDRVLDATALLQESGTPEPPADMLTVLDGGAPLGDMLAAASRQFADAHRASLHVPPEIALPVWETILLAPLPRPRSFRDFSGFEQHLAAAFARACYGLWAMVVTKRWSIRHAKAMKCRPATVSGRRS